MQKAVELHKMDVGILASYVGFWQWKVKRHFKPSVFKKLSDKTLNKYADAFDISIDELKSMGRWVDKFMSLKVYQFP